MAKAWTREEEFRLLKFREEGHTVDELAALLNRTRGSISRKIDSLVRKEITVPNPKRKGKVYTEDFIDESFPYQDLGCVCGYPGCKSKAGALYVLVPLCQMHHEFIRAETLMYYHKRGKEYERTHYNKIFHLTPWAGKDRK